MMSLMFFVHKFLLSCRTLEANSPQFLQHLRPFQFICESSGCISFIWVSLISILRNQTQKLKDQLQDELAFFAFLVLYDVLENITHITWRVANSISKRNVENIKFVVALSHRSQWGVGQILPCFYSQHLLLWYPHSISSTIFGSEKRSKYLHYCSCDLLQQEIFVNIGG